MLRNVTFECDKTAHSTIRNNKEYYRDNNKDCAAGADDAASPGGGKPSDALVDVVLAALLVKEGIVAHRGRLLISTKVIIRPPRPLPAVLSDRGGACTY